MAENLANNYVTTLAAPITSSGATSISVASATGAPAANFRIRIGSELMLVTAMAGTTWTVTRGAEGTTAATHLLGASVVHVLTAGALLALLGEKFDKSGGTVGGDFAVTGYSNLGGVLPAYTSTYKYLVIGSGTTGSAGSVMEFQDSANVARGRIVSNTGAAFQFQALGILPMFFYTNSVKRLGIDSNGLTTLTDSIGFGYGSGCGATVTQTTSKSTAVTLNKPTGRITLHNEALGAGAVASFIVNNSTISATDVVVANMYAGGSVANYSFKVQPAAGTFTIYVKNDSAGTLSEAVELNFAVVKGSTT